MTDSKTLREVKENTTNALEKDRIQRDLGCQRVQIVDFTSDTADAGKDLHTVYCQGCATYCMISENSVATVPQREADRCYVFGDSFYKLSAKYDAETVFVKRGEKAEKQNRLYCLKCGLQVGYLAKLAGTESEFCFLFKESVTDKIELN
eukprot:GHVP01031231.1.p1 GENE.GHVP01031231.1~~GHVP01031231.1.p1  ORF type:complete len:149 (+),score=18.31 GHVP01031231.1:50-496(+)